MPEFEMYSNFEYWPLHAFVHTILRSKSDVYHRRIRHEKKTKEEERAAAAAEASRRKACEEDTALGEQAIAGAESPPKHVDNPDTTMAVDEALENIVGGMSMMSVDPDKSTNSPGKRMGYITCGIY